MAREGQGNQCLQHAMMMMIMISVIHSLYTTERKTSHIEQFLEAAPHKATAVPSLTNHPSRKASKLDERDMRDTAGEVVIYEAFRFDVAQGQMNGAPDETRTHS